MRRRWIYDNKGNPVEVVNGRTVEAPMIMPDIKPYTSMLTGEVITSRSRHREHLREHGCVELGNDVPVPDKVYGIPDASPRERQELIRAQFDAMTHGEFKRALQRDIDRIRWNSREN